MSQSVNKCQEKLLPQLAAADIETNNTCIETNNAQGPKSHLVGVAVGTAVGVAVGLAVGELKAKKGTSSGKRAAKEVTGNRM